MISDITGYVTHVSKSSRFCVVFDEDFGLFNIKDTVVGVFFGSFDGDDEVSALEVCDYLNRLDGERLNWERECRARDGLMSRDLKVLGEENVRLKGMVNRLSGLHGLECRVCREELLELVDAYPDDRGLGEFMKLRDW